MLEVQANITEKFFQGFMKPLKTDGEKEDKAEEEDDEEEEDSEKEEGEGSVPKHFFLFIVLFCSLIG